MEQINRAMQALEDPEVRAKFEREVIEERMESRPVIDKTGGHEAIFRSHIGKTKKKKLDPVRALELAEQRRSQRESWAR